VKSDQDFLDSYNQGVSRGQFLVIQTVITEIGWRYAANVVYGLSKYGHLKMTEEDRKQAVDIFPRSLPPEAFKVWCALLNKETL
jgi:hypothetical protein